MGDNEDDWLDQLALEHDRLVGGEAFDPDEESMADDARMQVVVR